MAKRPVNQFSCQACGAVTAKWSGRCDSCGEWNTLVEERAVVNPRSSRAHAPALGITRLEGEIATLPRMLTTINELDRVLGGGLVPASVVLVGGDPGIGKSTLLLQATCALARAGKSVLYISGEEAIDQIRLRARRLGVSAPTLDVAASINVAEISSRLEEDRQHHVVVIDSIQTMWLENIESAPGSVAQVRSSAFELIRLAKTLGFSLILVGHVTKDGALAGPRVLEHMVDAVLTFEGDRGHQFRILRATKNRFGATDEIGVFAMTERGLEEVANPSALFLAERQGNVAGSAVFAGLEGTRPVLLEVQALVAAKPADGAPRRAVVGWDAGRLTMLLAVLEARCALKFNGMDVYLNIAGGLRVSEPAADLAVAAALVSALTGEPTSAKTAYFGEVGLSGEIRQVAQVALRLKEAEKLGFECAVIPRKLETNANKGNFPKGLHVCALGHLNDLIGKMAKKSR